MKKLLPLVLLLIGTGAGVGAGIFLRPLPAEQPAPVASAGESADHAEPAADHGTPTEREFVKLNNQFVVPVVSGRKVDALVVMALSVEVPEGEQEIVFKMEPKLRDSFLQVLFDHANLGGFDGAFTNANTMAVLRNALKEMAQKVLGKENVSDVLITEIARQDY